MRPARPPQSILFDTLLAAPESQTGLAESLRTSVWSPKFDAQKKAEEAEREKKKAEAKAKGEDDDFDAVGEGLGGKKAAPGPAAGLVKAVEEALKGVEWLEPVAKVVQPALDWARGAPLLHLVASVMVPVRFPPAFSGGPRLAAAARLLLGCIS